MLVLPAVPVRLSDGGADRKHSLSTQVTRSGPNAMAGIFEDTADLDELADAIRSSDAGERRVAILALADSGLPDAVALLKSALDDQDAGIRQQAAIALGSFDGAAAADALTKALVDADPAVARAAAESLAELKDPASAAVL